MREFFAIDIGGTAIKYGIINEVGQISYSNNVDTEAEKGSKHILEKVVNIIEKLKIINDKVYQVGISSAGLIDNKIGSVVYAGYTIPDYTGTNLKKYIENRTGLVVEVENDVNCALLGEKWIGLGKNLKNFVMITLGTGIGGAICIDGKLYTGKSFGAGEVGYMKIKGEDFQLRASASALVNRVFIKTRIENLNGKEVFRLAKTNKVVDDILNEFYDYLAEGLYNICTILNPEKIIIGGGITANETFNKGVNTAFCKYVDDIRITKDTIEIASLSNNAGIVGSVYKFI